MLRRLFWIALGIAIGYQLANRDRPIGEVTSGNPTVRRITERGRSLADRAGMVGMQAVQRARTEIRSRLASDGQADWN